MLPNNLRLTVRDGTGAAEVIGFGFGGEAEAARRAARCALLFTPLRNEWNGVQRIQLKLKGLRLL